MKSIETKKQNREILSRYCALKLRKLIEEQADEIAREKYGRNARTAAMKKIIWAAYRKRRKRHPFPAREELLRLQEEYIGAHGVTQCPKVWFRAC
ncbi:MAG: hypothetical protein OCU18_03740 [Candidatus Syntrophoarchaeum sp.]|nr:hypothetical protein [Candidatus Syntrophoarchaeum sp.]